MYVGHLGFALAGKGLRRGAPLWLLVLATQGCDWVQAIACVTAPEGTSAMWSHSIPAVGALAAVLSLASYLVTGDRGVAALCGLVAVSHLLADYVTGLKPTWPGGPTIGLDLYAYPLGDLAVETAVLVVGWLLYRRSLPPGSRSSRLSWALLVVLGATQLLGVFKLEFLPATMKCM
jgi:hypothetical protein